MSNTLNKHLIVISLDSFSQSGLEITFSLIHMFGYINRFIHIVEVGYTNIQSKIKINGFLI